MFLSEFACPSCGTLIQTANPVQVGRQVQCYACRTTFVVSKETALPPPQSPASVQVPSSDLIHSADQEEQDYEPAPLRLPQARRLQRKRLRPRDKLEGLWIAIIWASLALPLLGSWIIVLLSSIMYYVWRKDYPKKARSINRHGWMAWLLGQLIWCPIWIIANKDQWAVLANSSKSEPAPTVSNRTNSSKSGPARTVSNRARLVGIWEWHDDNGNGILEFRAGGHFRRETNMTDTGSHELSNGTWEFQSESEEQIKVRTVASGFGGPTAHVWNFVFLDDDTMALADRPEQVFHRRP